ncbi:conserved hypothetical protein [Sporisorium reilianum SRZ2]|uniref:Uncharacterized protein n=1 Tax=Sporisorium reilianum (strain SRZ2) TaxID=999809 RepID=E7A0P2_SPORE|nr:conserved hypothetical protein [Sporisorium reilianum SRZ2]
MSTWFCEAGPSRLSIAPTLLRCARPTRRAQLLDTPTSPPSPSDLMADEDEGSTRVGFAPASVDPSSDPASSLGCGSVPSSASHRYVPFFLRPMASEMVRPPEVVELILPPEWCPSVMR